MLASLYTYVKWMPYMQTSYDINSLRPSDAYVRR